MLVQLDKEPYQVQVNIKTSAVVAAKRELATAMAQARGLAARARSSRFKLDHAMEDVRNQIELLKSNVAQLKVEEANRVLAERDYARGETLVGKGGVSQQQFDQYKAALEIAVNRVTSAEQAIQQTRVSLGLPINHKNPLDIPEDLDENFSTVQEALAGLYASVTQLGYTPATWTATPRQVKETFYSQDPDKNLDRIFGRLIPESPAVKLAEARVAQAEDDLAQAELNLRYCDIVSEIDGQVTSRNVNPGNYVQIGQGLMAVRSLTEIWIDANFKETQLADQRIGQRVRCEVDMYGSRREFEGRITGFTMGTGTTLSLLPPQNATGNFVKIVQRLPVRIELTDYDPEKSPLFIGLSVVPYVYVKEPPTGPHAGEVLQPFAALPQGPVVPNP
jgi:membrane fusion protein (multidrug efflux system)